MRGGGRRALTNVNPTGRGSRAPFSTIRKARPDDQENFYKRDDPRHADQTGPAEEHARDARSTQADRADHTLCARLARGAGVRFRGDLVHEPDPDQDPKRWVLWPAAPYPSEIAVSGLTGPIAGVAVTLHRFGHTLPGDVDILLVSPSGDDVMLMSDACGRDENEGGGHEH